MLALAALLAPAAPAAEAPAPRPVAVVEMRLVEGLFDVEPEPQPLARTLSPTAPPGIDVRAAEGAAWFGEAPVTKTESLAYAVAPDRSALWLDSDMDRVLEPSERVQGPAISGGNAWFAVKGLVRQPLPDGTVREASIPMAVGIGAGVPPRGFSRLDCRREGTLEQGGRRVKLAVVDRTHRGWFSHLGRDLLLVDVDGDGRLEAGADSHERYRLGQPFPVGEADLVVTEVGPLGATLSVAVSPKPARRLAPLTPGSPAPRFEARDLAGAPVELAKLEGRWVLLDFWATWCAPCRAEVPHLKALRQAHPDLVVLGISGDRQREALVRFVETEKVEWPQVFDEKGELQSLYRVSSLPRSFLIAPDGRLAAKDLRGPMVAEHVARLKAAATR